jgi:hypothetical protein
MSIVLPICLAFLVSLSASQAVAVAADLRIDEQLARSAEMRVSLSPESLRLKAPPGADLATGLPLEYGSAMTWYRVALADGYMQPPLVASPWLRDDGLPEPLQWTWAADNGNVLTRTGKGSFRLSLANNRSNWFREVDCRLLSWPGGNAEATMTCADGVSRTLMIPGDGIVLVDDVQFVRVFDSEATTLPPQEVVSIEELTAAAFEAAGISAAQVPGARQPEPKPKKAPAATVALPEHGPIPQFR